MFKLSEINQKLKSLTSKEDNSTVIAPTEIANSNNGTGNQKIKVVARSWYEERYDKLIVQRNLLFLLLLTFLALSIVAVIMVAVILNSREFSPFVIQIDESTGIAKVVNPVSSEVLDGNEALARYFIKRYVTARETYNPVDFDTEARKSIRLLSTNSLYWNYIGYIKNKEIDPSIIYGQKNTTFLMIKSWSKLDKKKYIVRFSINETAGEKRIFNKIAVIDFDYLPMELTDAERDINPVGFQVKGYRVDEDNS